MTFLREFHRSPEFGCFIAGAMCLLALHNALDGWPVLGSISAAANAALVVITFRRRRRREQRQCRMASYISHYSDWRRGKA